MLKIAFLALVLVAAGCASREELERVKQELARINNKLLAQEYEAQLQREELARQISELENENVRLRSSVDELTQQLNTATNALNMFSNAYARITQRLYKQKQAAEEARQEEQRRYNAMLEQAKVSNRPEGYPYRVFDSIYIGTQTRDGITANYGRFSIRNYTDERLQGDATAGYMWGIAVDVPPNSVREGIYIRAIPDQPIRIRCNLGEKEFNWEKKN